MILMNLSFDLSVDFLLFTYKFIIFLSIYLISCIVSYYFIDNLYQIIESRDNKDYSNIILAKGFLKTLCFVPFINSLYSIFLIYQFLVGFLRSPKNNTDAIK